MKCDGTGIEVVSLIIWKEPREDAAPVRCSRAVEESESSWDVAVAMEKLRDRGALDVGYVSAAHPCSCRRPPEPGPAPVSTVDSKLLAAGKD